MKRYLFLIVMFALIHSSTYAQENRMVLRSHYPSPIGLYSKLQFVPLTQALPEPCKIGMMYFDNQGDFIVCQDNGTGSGEWKNNLLWGRDNNHIFLLAPDSYSTKETLVGVGTKTPEFKLSLEEDGGIIAKGNYGTGTVLSTAGAGVRFVWYPRKTAFRVGAVSGDQWDDAKIGDHSFSSVHNSTASASFSTAIGYLPNASAQFSTAIGTVALAGGGGSLAIGPSTSSAGVNSTCIRGNATGDYSTTLHGSAFGYGASSIGSSSRVFSDYATAIGSCVSKGNASTCIGGSMLLDAAGDYSLAMGGASHMEDAMGDGAVAIGSDARVLADHAVALGYSSYATAIGAIALGDSYSQRSYSLGIGRGNTTIAPYSTVIGNSLTARTYNETILGLNNIQILGEENHWEEADPLLILSNGANPSGQNAVVLLKNGKLGIGTNQPTSPLHVRGIQEFSGNTEAINGGLSAGDLYRNGDLLKIVY